MDEADVRDRLASITDPNLGDDIVSLGLVNNIELTDEELSIDVALGAPYSPTETEIANSIRELFENDKVDVSLSATVNSGFTDGDHVLPGVKNLIAVASGKGGVGKSTISVNLAAGLADMGARVGLFDADVYGPNIPRMVGADEPPEITERETMIPPKKHGIKLMSMDFLLGGDDDPVIWRGPMVHKVLTQLWEDVEWGALDYMIVDLPPGTGDTQLTLLQSVPVTGAVIVTTPQGVAIDDAYKGLKMFGEHETPVLGIVENMSGFICPDCGSEHDIFGQGGGKEFADSVDMPFLGNIPLDPAIRQGGDGGAPVILSQDDAPSDTTRALRNFAQDTADMQGIVHRQEHRLRVSTE